jgi:hypothetical protein
MTEQHLGQRPGARLGDRVTDRLPDIGGERFDGGRRRCGSGRARNAVRAGGRRQDDDGAGDHDEREGQQPLTQDRAEEAGMTGNPPR